MFFINERGEFSRLKRTTKDDAIFLSYYLDKFYFREMK